MPGFVLPNHFSLYFLWQSTDSVVPTTTETIVASRQAGPSLKDSCCPLKTRATERVGLVGQPQIRHFLDVILISLLRIVFSLGRYRHLVLFALTR